MRVPTRSDGTRSGRELDARERPAEHARRGLDRQRLREAGHALDQEVALREQADEHALEHRVLAGDHAADLEQRLLEPLLGLGGGRCVLPLRPRRRSFGRGGTLKEPEKAKTRLRERPRPSRPARLSRSPTRVARASSDSSTATANRSGAAEPLEGLGREELQQERRRPRREGREVDGQDPVVAEEQHRQRGGRLVRHQVTVCYLHAGSALRPRPARPRPRASRRPASARPTGSAPRARRPAPSSSRRARAPAPGRYCSSERDDRRIEHRPRLEPELDRRARGSVPRAPLRPASRPSRGPVVPYLSRPVAPATAPSSSVRGWPNTAGPTRAPPASSTKSGSAAALRLGDDRVELVGAQRLVRDREPRQHDELRVAVEVRRELVVAARVDELAARELHRAHDDRVRVAARTRRARCRPAGRGSASPRRSRPSGGSRRRRRRGPGRRRDARARARSAARRTAPARGRRRAAAASTPPRSSERSSPVKLKSVPSPCAALDDPPRRAQLRQVGRGVGQQLPRSYGRRHATSLRSR